MIKRHNHYVPEMYLSSWAHGKKINTYQILVPHEKVPVWKSNSVEYSASIDNLYVRLKQGEEVDDFEEEFMRKYETPAKVPLMKACSNERLTVDDWHVLIDFVAAQIVRTPAFYFKSQEIIKNILPDILESTGKTINKLSLETIRSQKGNEQNGDNLLPTSLRFTDIQTDSDQQYVEITTIVGKSTWLYSIRHLLSSTSSVLHQHKWSIVSASDGM